MKRKRKCHGELIEAPITKQKQELNNTSHPVLDKYYRRVVTLRDYLLSALPSTSKHRRSALRRRASKAEEQYTQILLDNVLVCSVNLDESTRSVVQASDHVTFSQAVASGQSSMPKSQSSSQAELVDFVIWLLFTRLKGDEHRPQHILCHGISRTYDHDKQDQHVQWTIPGFSNVARNEYVEELKGPAWSKVLELLGGHGQEIMRDMLINCSLFKPLQGSTGNLVQISGRPLANETVLVPSLDRPASNMKPVSNVNAPVKFEYARQPAEIRMVRHRMLYAKAALNAKGEANLGLRHIHVLNRYPDHTNRSHTVHIMKYIFPRQFGLHNVFTSTTDSKETTQQFKDYTLREEEISRNDIPRVIAELSTSHLPKRLRGKALELTQRLQKLHVRCSYRQLLDYHCPIPSNSSSSMSVTDVASELSSVSAFVRAVISRVWPKELYGTGDAGKHNWRLLTMNIDAFVRSRRFESVSLDSLLQGVKISSLEWLYPPNYTEGQKLAMSDYDKRKEIFAELVYFMFDSFIIPLIRSNFHVTESSHHRNRLFYFRHDVWRKLTEPALLALKASMLEEMPNNLATSILTRRTLGFSQIRLLPKIAGMRPIANLRRRAQILRNGKTVLGRSINSVLAPVFNVLKYEKEHQAGKLGSSLFSVSGIFNKLQEYKKTLSETGQSHAKLYFVKVDVQAAFDNIPQGAVQDLIASLLSEDQYIVKRHTEIKPSETHGRHNESATFKPVRKFCAEAQVDGGAESFVEAIEARPAQTRRHNTVFVDNVVSDELRRAKVLQLLGEHVGANVIRVGKKFYRQKKGIPQGSVLSSLLCNSFYADFEAKHLKFLKNDQSLLMRLIDDFLLVTTRKDLAIKFLQIMHIGNVEYGISVKPEKSLINFDAVFGGAAVPKIDSDKLFPYCGIFLDQKGLNISKDYSGKSEDRTTKDGLTVEYSRTPGQNLRRKTMTSLKLQLNTMLLSTKYNTRRTVVSNLYSCMLEVAKKTLAYLKNVTKDEGRLSKSLICMVEDLTALANAMMKSNRNKLRSADYQCSVGQSLLRSLTYQAFATVFRPKQTVHRSFVLWLDETLVTVVEKCSAKERLWLEKFS